MIVVVTSIAFVTALIAIGFSALAIVAVANLAERIEKFEAALTERAAHDANIGQAMAIVLARTAKH